MRDGGRCTREPKQTNALGVHLRGGRLRFEEVDGGIDGSTPGGIAAALWLDVDSVLLSRHRSGASGLCGCFFRVAGKWWLELIGGLGALVEPAAALCVWWSEAKVSHDEVSCIV